MKKIFTLFLTVLLSVFFLASTSMAKPPEGMYKASISGSLEVGKDGLLTLHIVPAKGYKWNKQYPAKLVLANDANVSFSKTEYKQLKGEMKAEGKGCTVDIAAKAAKAGNTEVHAVMSLSICNEETCHVLRKRKLKFSVAVRGSVTVN